MQPDPEDLKRWLDGYVSGFYSDHTRSNENVRLKYEHTLRVRENIRRIARGLNLPEPETRLAEVTALLHDIGRFRQYADYGTFNDRISENHAGLGLKEIVRHRILAGFEKKTRSLIARAVAFHNRIGLPDGVGKETLLFARMLRDADKIDICKVFADYFTRLEKGETKENSVITLGLSNEPKCSRKVLDAFQHQRFASVADAATVDDYKLLLVSWVFDLNFPVSFRLIKENKHLEQIAATLPPDKAIRSAVDTAFGHVSRFLNQAPSA